MTPNEILNKNFGKSAVGGYRTEEVHTYLVEVSDYIKKLHHDQQDLERKLLFLAEKIEEYREDEESLRAALINAQKTSEKVIQQAQAEAAEIKAKANAEAKEVLKKASSEADILLADTKVKVDTEAYTLNRMQMEVSKFRGQVLNMYERQIELINALPFDLDLKQKQVPKPDFSKQQVAPSQSSTTIVHEDIATKSSEEDTPSLKASEVSEEGMQTEKRKTNNEKENKATNESKENKEGFRFQEK